MRPETSFSLSDIPGLAEALESARSQQYVTRENSLLNITYDICGFKIRTMTIADYVLLERNGSPFLNRTEPTMADLAFFLWMLSPQFLKWSKRRWLGFLQPASAFLHSRRVGRILGKNIPETSEPAVVKCFEYIDTMFFDAPPSIGRGGESCLCYLTGWFDSIQSEYHFDNDKVWEMGLPELFQRLAAISQRINPGQPKFNKKTDDVKAFILRGLRTKQFTVEDLKSGRVKDFGVN